MAIGKMHPTLLLLQYISSDRVLLEMICPEAIQERGLYNLSPEYVEKCLELDQSIETKRSKWGKTPVCFYTVLVGLILAIAGKKKRITYAA